MTAPNNFSISDILATVRRYWGYSELRPLQEQAIKAGLEQRDSLVVMPTGGGKSLCYQVPPQLAQRTDIVVSPLISLMKDQVDGLRECGYPAAALYSGMTPEELRRTEEQMVARRFRLVFVAPERLLTPRFLQLVERLEIGAFAIDEAHCISQWGHDFRPEYRQLANLKKYFPEASVHAPTSPRNWSCGIRRFSWAPSIVRTWCIASSRGSMPGRRFSKSCSVIAARLPSSTASAVKTPNRWR